MFETIKIFLFCLIGMCPNTSETPVPMDAEEYKAVHEAVAPINEPPMRVVPIRPTLSGHYLSSRFAQRHHDWGRATNFVNGVLKYAPGDLALKKRAMVLAMGAGVHDFAIEKAQEVLEEEPQNALALLFVAMADFKNQNYEAGTQIIQNMPDGSLSAFIMPLLESWAQASMGVNDTKALKNSALHIYHAILIADYLEQHDTVKSLLAQSLTASDISTDDLARIAGIYGHIGDTGKAKELYKKILMIDPDNLEVTTNLGRIDSGEDVKIFQMVDSPEDGLSVAMYDMARILYGDYSDESARIFGHLAVYLNPEKTNGVMLLGHIAARNDRYDEAINFYKSVPEDHPKYADARRLAANLLEDAGRIKDALAALQALVDNEDNLDALMQIGDIHRRNENFNDAIRIYNKAEEKLGGDIPADYWQLHYVRGMSYEQMGNWPKAEADLSAALEFQPEHPFVLNYLGYSWADQGVNLEQSREMIERAVNLRPDDGYIADSLGWVLYRMGLYDQAIAPLERAVELLPYDPVINDHLGDAYWKVGRRLEARFQWQRARNHSDDDELITAVQHKIVNGLDQPMPVSEAADAEDAAGEHDETEDFTEQ